MREQFKVLAAEKLAADAGSGFHYSNANYLLLGLAIEELSGGEYEQICREQVLLPINVTARLNERWKVMSSWGGWKLSSLDYLKFLNRYFSNNQIMNKNPQSIALNTPVGRGAYYSLGTLTRAANGGHRFWHAGSWRWRGNGRNDQFGAYFLTREDGLMVSLNYSTHAQNEKLRDLENRLIDALGLRK
jgi:CubicO group peptidase (beta-lactamase class C family)